MSKFHIPHNAPTLPNGRLSIAQNVECDIEHRTIYVGRTAFSVEDALKRGFVSPAKVKGETGGGLHYLPGSGIPRGARNTN